MLDPACHSVNSMRKLVVCALLAMAPLAQADRVTSRDGADGQSGELSTQMGGVMIAQVAAETAQLLPSNRPGATPSPKLTHGSKSARVKPRSSKTKVVNTQHFKPSALGSKYKNDAEQFAKANGCAAPVATMKVAVVGPESFETFAVTCGTDVSMSIRCDPGRCRAM